MRVVVDYDLCESNAVCMGDRARGVRGARRRLPLRAAGEPPEELAPRSRRPCGAARSRPSPSRGLTSRCVIALPRSSSSAPRWPACAPPRRCAPRATTARSRSSAPSRTALRPAAAVEAGPGRHVGRRPHRRSPAGRVDDLDLDWRLGVAATGPRPRRPRRARSPAATGCPTTASSSPPARRPAGCPAARLLDGVHVLRTLDDCLAPAGDARRARPTRVVVVGAGFIGAEVAATCREPRPRRHHARGAARPARAGARRARWAR